MRLPTQESALIVRAFDGNARIRGERGKGGGTSIEGRGKESFLCLFIWV